MRGAIKTNKHMESLIPWFHISLLRRGIFVLREGCRERKTERAFSLFPSLPARFLFFLIIAIFIGIPSGSLCGGERFHMTCGGHIGVPNKCCESWTLSARKCFFGCCCFNNLVLHRYWSREWKHSKDRRFSVIVSHFKIRENINRIIY